MPPAQTEATGAEEEASRVELDVRTVGITDRNEPDDHALPRLDLEKKLATWERFYNFDRPHGAHGVKTPYEALREKLS